MIQAIAESVVEAVNCNGFFRMIGRGRQYTRHMLKFMQKWLQRAPSIPDDKFRPVLQESIDRITKVAKAMVSLLRPEQISSTQEIMDLKAYKGAGSFESALRASLGGDFYTSIVDDMLKTASATKEHENELVNFGKLFEGAAAIKEDFRLGRDDLAMLVDTIPELKSKVRRGALDKVETKLLKQLQKHAEDLLDISEPGVEAIKLYDVVLKGLSEKDQHPGVLDIITKLRSWHSQHSAAVNAVHREAALRKAVACPEVLDVEQIVQLSMDHMAEASKTEKEQFLALIPQLMHAAKDEVRRGSLGLWGGGVARPLLLSLSAPRTMYCRLIITNLALVQARR